MKYMIEVTVDGDDGDVSQSSEITSDALSLIRPLLEKMKEFKEYQVEGRCFNCCYPSETQADFARGEKTNKQLYPDISEEAFEILDRCIPYLEYGYGLFLSVKIRQVVEEEVYKF